MLLLHPVHLLYQTQKNFHFLEHKTTNESGINNKEVSQIVEHAVPWQSISRVGACKGTTASKKWLLLAFCCAIYSMLVSLNPAPSLFKTAATKVLGHLLTQQPPAQGGLGLPLHLFLRLIPKSPLYLSGFGKKRVGTLTESN